MGFFSWNCVACGISVNSTANCDKDIAWQNDVVAINKETGLVIAGWYDGYGRIETDCMFEDLIPDLKERCPAHFNTEDDRYTLDPNIKIDGVVCLYHRACWDAAGQPRVWRSSTPAQDQGYFFGHPGEHDAENPTKSLELLKKTPLEMLPTLIDHPWAPPFKSLYQALLSGDCIHTAGARQAYLASVRLGESEHAHTQHP